MHNIFSKSLCPYCYKSFYPWEKMYRCQALTQVCKPVEDTVYHRHFGTKKIMGHVVTPSIRGFSDLMRFLSKELATRCTSCASLVTQPICPGCHGHLPKRQGKTPVVPILLAGASISALKTYRSALLHQLQAAEGHIAGMIVEDLAEGDGIIISFEIAQGRRTRLPCFISTFPMVTWKDLARLPRAFDINKLSGVIAVLSGKALGDIGHQYAMTSLKALLDVADEERSFWQKTPLAIALDDMEKWQACVPGGSVLWGRGQHTKGYDVQDGSSVSAEVRACFGYWAGLNVLQFLKKNFKTYSFFGISKERYSTGRVAPYARVEDPYFWLLYRQKILEKML